MNKNLSTMLTGNQTDFTVHKSHRILEQSRCQVIDFTERRLFKYSEKITDPVTKLVIMAMISDYIDGNIAIAWLHGRPIYVRISKNPDTGSP